MARRITRKNLKQDEFVEAAFDAKQWLEKHWQHVAFAMGGVILAAALFGAWSWWSGYRKHRAQEALSAALDLYYPSEGAPRYDEALGAFEAAAEVGGTSSLGRLGTLYRATTLLKLGRATEAIPVLERVIAEAEDPTVRDTARAVLAQAHEQAGALDNAAAAWRALSEDADSTYPPEMALLNLGHVLNAQGKSEEAQRTWQELIARYPDGVAGREARGLLGQPLQ